MNIFRIPSVQERTSESRDRIHLSPNVLEIVNGFHKGVQEISVGIGNFYTALSPEFIALVAFSLPDSNYHIYRQAYLSIKHGFEDALAQRDGGSIDSFAYKLQEFREGIQAYNGLILFAREHGEQVIDTSNLHEYDKVLGTYYPFHSDELGGRYFWPKYENREETLKLYLDNLHKFVMFELLNEDELLPAIALGFVRELKLYLTREDLTSARDISSILDKLELAAEQLGIGTGELRRKVLNTAMYEAYTFVGTDHLNYDFAPGQEELVRQLNIPRDDILYAYSNLIPSLINQPKSRSRLEPVLQDISKEDVARIKEVDDMLDFQLSSSLRFCLHDKDVKGINLALKAYWQLVGYIEDADLITEFGDLFMKSLLKILADSTLASETIELAINCRIFDTESAKQKLANKVLDEMLLVFVAPQGLRAVETGWKEQIIQGIKELGLDTQLPQNNCLFVPSEWKTSDLLESIKKYPAFYVLMRRKDAGPQVMTANIMRAIRGSGFDPFEIEVMLRSHDEEIDLDQLAEDLATGKNYDAILDLITKYVFPWAPAGPFSDIVQAHLRDFDNFFTNIARPVIEAATFFSGGEKRNAKGARKIFKYLSRPDVTRHDALQSMFAIINLARFARNWGYTHNQFYGNILNQVLMDKSPYVNDSTSLHEMNRIAESLSFDMYDELWERITSEITPEDEEILRPILAVLQELTDKKEIFASWANLKAANKALQIYASSHIVFRLRGLKNSAPSLFKLVNELMKHPDVSLKKIEQLLSNPQEYLAASKSDPAFMPANFVNIPGLDWGHNDVLEAMYSEKADRVKRFPSMKKTYQVLVPPGDSNLIEACREWAMQVKDSVLALIPFRFDEDEAFIKNKFLPWLVNNWDMVGNQYFPDWKFLELSLEETSKSSAIAQLGGNDTGSCMSFGRSKAVEYSANMGFGIMITQLNEEQSELPLVVTQSVTTEDVYLPAGVEVGKLHAWLRKGKPLLQILSEDVLYDRPKSLAYDNIEVVSSYAKNTKLERVLRSILNDFALSYHKMYFGYFNWNQEGVLLGRHAEDELAHTLNHPNKTIPGAGMSYSDKVGGNVVLISHRDQPTCEYIVNSWLDYANKPFEAVEYESVGEYYSRKITYSDALQLAYLAELAGDDSINFLDLRNSLIGTALYAACSDLPNPLGKVVLSKDGKIIAFAHYYWGVDAKGVPRIHRRYQVIHPAYEARREELENILESEIYSEV